MSADEGHSGLVGFKEKLWLGEKYLNAKSFKDKGEFECVWNISLYFSAECFVLICFSELLVWVEIVCY